MPAERLQKILARAGVASRRAAEELIVNGRVKVDGRVVTELGTRVDARRVRIDLDNKRLVAEPFVYVILHKPRGVMCTLSDPEGRQTVVDLLKGVGVRVVPVGRLDYHTSGALLCTNDGDFAGKLLHPRGGVPKEYVAKVRGLLNDESLARWGESIEIEGRATRPAEVRFLRHEGDKSWISLVLHEGRNRQVRRLGEATGFPVLRLARVAHAGITTDGLRPGQWRHLTRDELIELKKNYGVPRSIHSADPESLARRPARPEARRSTRKATGPSAPRPSHGSGLRSERGAVTPRASAASGRGGSGRAKATIAHGGAQRSSAHTRASSGRERTSAPNTKQ
ncbi:MAG TPA: pseudouridine synthase, partial [Polyangiaceae bacterium]|nr:pseudouridine synthase [Polyangiaceae bacterium]